MLNNSLVSIIVPFFNSEKYLERCLNSLLNQTYTNLEIILVNDGSSDSSLSICREWCNRDSRFQVFSQENSGQGAARNYGINVANGTYIMFTDSDDFIHPQMVEVLLKYALDYNADIVQCGYQEVNEEVSTISFSLIKYSKEKCCIDNDKTKRLLCYYTEDIIPVNKLIDARLIKPYRFPSGMYYEDKHLMFRLRYFADTIVTINEKLYYYVQTHDSTMRQAWNDKRFLSSFRIINELAQFCKEYNLTENYKSELSGYLRKLLSLYYHADTEPSFKKYKTICVDTIKLYLPDLINNRYIRGKYKVIVLMLLINVKQTLAFFCLINKIRLWGKKHEHI